MNEDVVRALRESLKENDRLRRTTERLAGAARAPIAIVGMGCRYPGGIASPEDLWEVVDTERDVIGPFPTDRGWDLSALYDPDPDVEGTCYATQGGFVGEAGAFDAGFFGISPREATATDPQHRLLLEVTWEALERSRIAPASLRGTPTGVFIGAAYQGYGESWRDVPDGLQGHLVTGMSTSVMSGRISYTLGLNGPAVTVDTACSSSLVALHLAVQSLRTQECSLAVAGGAAIMAAPIGLVGFARQRGLAADGRCKAFADEADGMGLGEGAGVVVLERLADARRNGHPILAVVAGSALNQDGASNGLSAPSGPAQRAVIDAALARAGLGYDDVDLVETHGTGTRLGDPIEAQALQETYGTRARPVPIGSVKSNIGHAQAASGVAGVIKSVLALRHQRMPRSLHAQTPSTIIDWEAGSVEVLREARDWPAASHPRRAAVSSFGVSGTNAHVILAEPDVEAPQPAAPSDAGGAPDDSGPAPRAAATHPLIAPDGVVPLVLSARSASALKEAARRLHDRLVASPDLRLADVAWSLATTRDRFEHRAAVLAGDVDAALSGLRALSAGEPHDDVVVGRVRPDAQTVFVFPGQGSQWAGMTRELARSCPTFARRLSDCDAALAPHLDVRLSELIAGDDDAWLQRVDLVQPALWAVMVALAGLWSDFGVTPAAVVGHSQGEIAAAVVAAGLDLDDAATVVARRAAAITRITGRGGMLSVSLPQETAREWIESAGRALSLAAVNGPAGVVVSGDADALDDLERRLTDAGHRARRVNVDYASHSAHVEELEDEIRTALAGIGPRVPQTRLPSTVTGHDVAGPELDGDYWYRNLRGTVLLESAVRSLAERGASIFVECSAHPVLQGALVETLTDAGDDEPAVLSTLRRDDGGLARFRRSLLEAFVVGASVDPADLIDGADAATLDLPTYPFESRHHWLPSGAVRSGGAAPVATDDFWDAVDAQDLQGLARALDVEPAAEWGALLPVLAGYHAARVADERISRLRYTVGWAPLPAPRAATGATGATVGPAVFVVTHEAPPAAADALDALRTAWSGPSDVVSLPAEAGREAVADALSAAVEGVRTDAAGPVTVVSLLALDTRPVGDRGCTVGMRAALALAQATGRVDASLWAVTQGAVATAPTDHVVAPDQAASWALRRILAVEQPGTTGGVVDLPPRLDARAAARVLAHLAGGGEAEVAVRGSGVSARRVTRAAAPSKARWSPRGTVLITGGTGALGGHVATWAARHGAARVVLVSRGGSAAADPALVAAVEEAGATCEVVAADIADAAAMAPVVARLDDLRAVVHAAGVLDDGILDGLDPAGLDAVLAPKVAGARVLADLTRERELDAFVMFSSFAAVAGGVGQGAYAAANAVLDALATQLRAQGRPVTAVAWGAWAGGGLVDADTAGRLAETGMAGMDPQTALDALASVVTGTDPTPVVADVDWDRMGERVGLSDNPVFAELVAAARPAASGAASGPEASRPARGDAWTLDAVDDVVRRQIAAVLRLDDPGAVDPRRALRDLGFDSLTAVDLRRRLGEATGLRLPVTLVFDHPTCSALVEHLAQRLGAQEDATGADPETAADRPPAPAADSTTHDPIAVVSMACRFPGGVRDPEGLWRLLAGGVDAVGDFPTDRGWELGRFDPDPDVPGTFYARGGGFLDGPADFDAEFFGVSPRESLCIDPQQRLLLETTWEAFENAGIDPTSTRGSRTGVYLGASYNDYGSRVRPAPPELEGYLALGSSSSVASGRISYTFGLEGPAVSIDTACSSSLVALHLAVKALRGGECEAALAAGAVVMSTLDSFIEFSRQRAMSPDGRCKAFSADADGAGWAEGVGVVLLEPLSVARRRGHPVLAVVAGSAVDQDGASNGLTAPSGPAQQAVITAALADAGLAPGDVDAVEAHGTGTSLGDPIEAEALLATYGVDRERPLHLGALKSNIGHTQAAAGIAGVIKTVLALTHEELPRTLHAQSRSTHIDWDGGPLALLQEPVRWERSTQRRRVAGVSAFGVSGTNAHVLLADPPAGPEEDTTRPGPAQARPGVAAGPDAPVVWVVSGRGEAALRAQASRLLDVTDADPLLVGRALAARRAHLENRAAVRGTSLAALRGGLAAVADGGRAPGTTIGHVTGRRTVAMFTGQGSQRRGMGLVLHETFDAYADAFDEVCAHVDPILGRSLLDAVRDGGPLADTAVAQPALFAVEVALYRLVESWGLRPDLLVGHSIGEIAAAHAAGILTLPDASALVAHRGRLMQALPGGAMTAVRAGEEEVAAHLSALDRADELGIAAVNGPASTVVSGSCDAVEQIEARLSDAGLRTKRMPVGHAFHSPLMAPMAGEFAELVAGLPHARGHIPLVSALTGEVVRDLEPTHWVTHVTAPVRFSAALAACESQGAGTYLELGPGGVLSAMAPDCLGAPATVAAALPREDDPEPDTLVNAVAAAYTAGTEVDWSAYLGPDDGAGVALPTYAFQRRRYWLDATDGLDAARAGLDPAGHPLLDADVTLPDGDEHVLVGAVRPGRPAWLSDHVVPGGALVPGTAFADLALHVGDVVGAHVVDELMLQAPLAVPTDASVALRVVTRPAEAGEHGIEVHSRVDDGPWVAHASGRLVPGEVDRDPIGGWPPAGAEEIDVSDLYELLGEAGFAYGPTFRGLQRAWRAGPAVLGEVALPEGAQDDVAGHGLHPALFDAALHTLAFCDLPGLSAGYVPFAWSGLRLHATGATQVRVRATPTSDDTVRIELDDPAGRPVATVEGLTLRPIATDGVRATRPGVTPYDLAWVGLTLPGQAPRAVTVLSGDGVTGASDGIADALTRAGVDVTALTAVEEAAGDDRDLVVALPVPDGPPAHAARATCSAALDLLHRWLALDAPGRLVLLTRGATGQTPDPAQAAAAGLVASAITENPGRVALVDLPADPDAPAPAAHLATSLAAHLAAALVAGEPRVAISEREVLAPRLAPAPPGPAIGLSPEGTTLVTGATGTLGGLVARHLVQAHGVRSLVLAGRRGEAAPGMTELVDELRRAGADVTVAACDVGDESAVRALLADIDPQRPLRAIVHAAGALDDGVVTELTPERFETVFAAKIDATLVLDRIAAELDLDALVLFSSVAGVLGGAGQGGYAAGNAFVDAVAAGAAGAGRAVVSLAWGLWAERSGMTAAPGEAATRRAGRSGIVPMATQTALGLFDASLAAGPGVHVPVELDLGALRRQSGSGGLPPAFTGLVPAGPRRRSAASDAAPEDLAGVLAGLDPQDRRERLIATVRSAAADILGHGDPAALDPDRGLLDLGFDSLTAVELRNRLGRAAGIKLPVTLLFDHPSVAAVAAFLDESLPVGDAVPSASPASPADDGWGDLDRFARLVADRTDDGWRAQARERLEGLLATLTGPGGAVERELATAADDELFDFIDRELGR